MNIRWMVTKDLDKVADIELRSNDFYLNRQDLILLLRKRNVVAMVATDEEEEPVGFMIYELMNRRIHLMALAVHPKHRNNGIGSRLVQKLISKLSPKKRTKISVEVRESNLPVQLFLKNQGFMAVEVLRAYFEDTQEDAFVMHYNLNEEK